MSELWLHFDDGSGNQRSVRVDSDEFTIGRSGDNSLSIADQRLSRQHACIRRYGSEYVLSDLGSSNGTALNGKVLTSSAALREGDALDLGGGVLLATEFKTAADSKGPQATSTNAEASARTTAPEESRATAAGARFPKYWLLVIPILGVIAFLCGGGGLLILKSASADPSVRVRETREDAYEDDSRKTEPESESEPKADASPPQANEPKNELLKVEANAAKFLRTIALNDPNAFLTAKQAETVLARIEQLKRSGGLGEHLKAATKSATEIEGIASAQGLKPEFLVAAAITKLGGSKGDIVATARTMVPVFADLRISLGNSLGDDNLLMAADFLRREAGRKPSLQTVLEAVSKSESSGKINPREIRTIWFLRDKGKLSEENFEFALRFLAVGTVMQSPADFGVNP